MREFGPGCRFRAVSAKSGPGYVRNRRMEPGDDIPAPFPEPSIRPRAKYCDPVCSRSWETHPSGHRQGRGPAGQGMRRIPEPRSRGNVTETLCRFLGYSGRITVRVPKPCGQCGTPGARIAGGGQPVRHGNGHAVARKKPKRPWPGGVIRSWRRPTWLAMERAALPGRRSGRTRRRLLARWRYPMERVRDSCQSVRMTHHAPTGDVRRTRGSVAGSFGMRRTRFQRTANACRGQEMFGNDRLDAGAPSGRLYRSGNAEVLVAWYGKWHALGQGAGMEY